MVTRTSAHHISCLPRPAPEITDSNESKHFCKGFYIYVSHVKKENRTEGKEGEGIFGQPQHTHTHTHTILFSNNLVFTFQHYDKALLLLLNNAMPATHIHFVTSVTTSSLHFYNPIQHPFQP